MDIKKLQDLYDQGRVSDIVKIVENFPLEEKTSEMERILAWAYFRLGEYGKSLQIATKLSDEGDKGALELISQIAAYISKDDDLIAKIRESIPENSSVCNALAIRARDPDSRIPIEMVVKAAINLMNNEEIGAVNLLNNTARLLLAKGDGRKDVFAAIGLWKIALIKYGEGKNFHHRAAVHFWLSKAYEGLESKDLALRMAYESYNLWKYQAHLDPENKQYQEKMKGAWERIGELEGWVIPA